MIYFDIIDINLAIIYLSIANIFIKQYPALGYEHC